jgi:hypothetical protein
MTGVLDIRNHLISRSGSITEISDGNLGKSWSQTGIIDLTKMVLIDGRLYMSNGGTLRTRDA